MNDEVSYCTDGLGDDYRWFSLASLVPWVPPLPCARSGGAWVWRSSILKSKGSED